MEKYSYDTSKDRKYRRTYTLSMIRQSMIFMIISDSMPFKYIWQAIIGTSFGVAFG